MMEIDGQHSFTHFKNFSLLETELGDYRLSPAYDLLNTRIHIEDTDFALDDGLLPRNLTMGKVAEQFRLLAEHTRLVKSQTDGVFDKLLSNSEKAVELIEASYLSDKIKRNYLQSYRTKLKKLNRKP